MMKENMYYDEELSVDEHHLIKKLLKKLIRKSVLFLIKPYVSFQNKVNEELLRKEEEIDIRLNKKIEKMNDAAESRERQQKDILIEQINCVKNTLEKNVEVMARQIMYAKWHGMDEPFYYQESGEDSLICRICGFSQKRNKYEIREADCMFNGGHLVRYVCPKCGVIFGPTKFMNQSQKNIDEDYKVHYLGFSEGDSSYKEERTFFMLKPEKEKAYLNYGCGHWSHTLQNLRKQGYKVYGYEPYSPDSENPYLITSREQLSKMRFDGIFSNDLLEHLLYPVEDLKFMRSLLLNKNAKMAHCTSCYVYKYENTRFHTHFFTGDSVKIMCEKAGLHIADYCNDIENNDFICYVFENNQDANSQLNSMFVRNGERDHSGFMTLYKNGIIYGPYLNLLESEYFLTVMIRGESGYASLKITSQNGNEILSMQDLHVGVNEIKFVLEQPKDNLEFVIENMGDEIIIENILLS